VATAGGRLSLASLKEAALVYLSWTKTGMCGKIEFKHQIYAKEVEWKYYAICFEISQVFVFSVKIISESFDI
jgi:hypothetical protein